MGTLSVLLDPVQEDVQQAKQGRYHEAERTGGRLHGLPHRHVPSDRRANRFQHAGRQTVGARL